MKKWMAALGAVALAVSVVVPPAAAQEVVSAEARRVTIGGYIGFDAVMRDTDIFLIGPEGEHFVNTDLTIELTIDMREGVRAFIQLRDDWVEEAEFTDIMTDFGLPLFGPVTPGNPWSGDEYNLEIEQAYIEVEEFLVPEFDMRIGIQNLAWDLRGNGDEFLLNLNENHNYGSVWEAGAWRATYDADPLMFEGFVATIMETLGSRTDVALYGASATYLIDDMSKCQLGLLVLNNDSVQTYWVDLGVDYWVDEGLEIYGEGAYQFGEWSDALLGEIDAAGMGGYVGAMYTANEYEYRPSIDLSFWYLSGDDDLFDTDSEWFLSLEDVDTFAIIEENHYGWDFDSNYMAAKACGSAKPADDVTVDVKVGWFKLVEELPGSDKDDLGIEVDASLTWQYSENLAFKGLVAYLFGSDVIEEQVQNFGVSEDAEDSGLLAMFSTVLVF